MEEIEKLEEKAKNLKIKGYDVRRAIDIKDDKIKELTTKYNNIVIEISKIAKTIENIKSKQTNKEMT